MPKPHQPRAGSMQFWPRSRAKRQHARVRTFAEGDGLQAFAGYKMGMTHIKAFDTNKNSITKNETVSLPVTILECPPLRLFAVRGYRLTTHGLQVAKEIVVAGKDKYLQKHFSFKPASSPEKALEELSQYDEVRAILYTQPHMTGIGQKKPQLFEVALGKSDDRIAQIKEMIGKDLKASEFLTEGEQVDMHAITTGRGNQGPVKRFGIGLKGHKSEKGRRRPGSLGGWSGQQHVMYRVAFSGQTGYHQRVQYNNQIVKITDNPDEVNVNGGYLRYGEGRKGNEFVLIKGSIPGPKKRLITMVKPIRQTVTKSLPTVDEISLASKQGK